MEAGSSRKATKLSDFITYWPCTGRVPPDISKLVTKIGKEREKNWSNCTLEDVEQFRTTLTQKLLLPSFVTLYRYGSCTSKDNHDVYNHSSVYSG